MTTFLKKLRDFKTKSVDSGKNGTLLQNDVDGSRRSSSRKGYGIAYSVDQLLKDSSALAFFINFLESSNKIDLIQCWMHVEGFRCSLKDSASVAQSQCRIDAMTIYERYINESAIHSIALPKQLRKLIRERIDKEDVDEHCFDEVSLFIKNLFHLRYFHEFTSSIYYKKHELEVLENGCCLSDILHSQSLLQLFMEMIDPSDVHKVQFLISCESFEANYSELSDEELMEDSMAMYNRFFSLQASSRIVVSDNVRFEIESSICAENGKPDRNSFRSVFVDVYSSLENLYLTSFCQSDIFQRHLQDIRSQIDHSVELPSATRRSQRDDDASTSSTDSQQSLFNKHCTILDSVCSSPNTSDSFFTRSTKKTHLAEVDNMGRYRPLYDDSITCEARSPLRLKTRLKKLIDKKYENDELMAEEVAKSIIADVQSMVNNGKRG